MAMDQHQRVSFLWLVVLSYLLAVRGVASLTCPGNINRDSGSNSEITVEWVNPNVNNTCIPQSGTSFTAGKMTNVRCNNMYNDTDTCTFQVNILDTASPSFGACPERVSEYTTMGTATGQPVWDVEPSDNVEVESTVCIPPSMSHFTIGDDHTVVCTARDSAGNTALPCTFPVVITDNEAPKFTACPDSSLVVFIQMTESRHSNSFSTAVTWVQPTAQDNSGLAVTLQSSHESGAVFPVGTTTTVTYNATDPFGNSKPCEFDVQVLVQPPSEHIYIDTPSDDPESCLSVKWPITKEDQSGEKSISYWQEEKGKMTTPPQEVIHTYSDVTATYGGPELICDLAAGELYTVRVDKAQSQYWTKPNRPAALSLVPGTLSTNSIELTWTPISLRNVQQYMVRISSERQPIRYVTKMTSRLRVDGLKPNTEYTASVRTVVGSGAKRMKSDSVDFIFKTADLAKSELAAFDFTESTISVAWSEDSLSSSPTEPYMLFIEPQDAKKNFLTVVKNGDPLSASFQDLKPNTEYYIRLIHNRGLSLSTKQKTRPAPIENLRPTAVLEESFTLEWDPPAESDIDSHDIYISPGSSTDPITDVTGTSYTFDSLEPETEYFVSIVSEYEGMKSVPRTLMVTTGITTPADPAPLNILAIGLGGGLGLMAFVLFICILVMCRKIRRRKAEIQQGTGLRKSQPEDHSYVNETMGLKKLTLRVRRRPKVPESADAPHHEPPAYDIPDING